MEDRNNKKIAFISFLISVFVLIIGACILSFAPEVLALAITFMALGGLGVFLIGTLLLVIVFFD